MIDTLNPFKCHECGAAMPNGDGGSKPCLACRQAAKDCGVCESSHAGECPWVDWVDIGEVGA